MRKQYRTMDPITVTCEACGEEFLARTHHVRFCERCRKAISKIYGRINRTVEKERRMDVAVDMRKQELARVVERKKKRESGEKRRCLYCGSTWNAESGFCTTCRRSGLDDVYKVTGRSNGWERREAAKKAVVVDGWRGRPCAGGKSQKRDRMSAVISN